MKLAWLFVRAVASLVWDAIKVMLLIAVVLLAVRYLGIEKIMAVLLTIAGILALGVIVVYRMMAIEKKQEKIEDKDWTCHE